ncbi:MAG: TIGR00730 family Rossman fold protein [Gammaproteobacteria bacterium]
MKSVCVFCGSNAGDLPQFAQAAQALGRAVAVRGHRLVYGGGRIGLMGICADTALEMGGQVLGVIPRNLFRREIVHDGLSELRVVDTLLERKAIMIEHSHACIVLPGGYGTLDELFEVLTWTQLGIRARPTGLVNVDGFYDRLIDLLDTMVDRGFLRPAHRALLQVDTDAGALLDRLLPPGPAGGDASRRALPA